MDRKRNVDPHRYEQQTPGYALFNVHASYRKGAFEASGGVDNLLNKAYELPLGGVNMDDFMAGMWMGSIKPVTGRGEGDSSPCRLGSRLGLGPVFRAAHLLHHLRHVMMLPFVTTGGFYKRGCQEKTPHATCLGRIFFLTSSPCRQQPHSFRGHGFPLPPFWEIFGVISLCVSLCGLFAPTSSGWRLPTMVLSETRGLWLCGVVRGGIRWPLRLKAPKPAKDTHPRTRALELPLELRDNAAPAEDHALKLPVASNVPRRTLLLSSRS